MPAAPSPALARRRFGLSVAIGALALGACLAGAILGRPFTLPAELAAGGGIALGAALVVLQHRARPAPALVRRSRADLPVGAWPYAGWGLLITGVVVWELLAFIGAPREAHPTLSSLLASVGEHPLGRGALCAGWLAYGWYLLTR